MPKPNPQPMLPEPLLIDFNNYRAHFAAQYKGVWFRFIVQDGKLITKQAYSQTGQSIATPDHCLEGIEEFAIDFLHTSK